MTNPTIDQKLQEQYDQLTPRERLLADFILAHPQDLALFNTAELARMCGVSKATVSRLFKRLGFSSFKEGRAMARKLRQQGVPVAGAPDQQQAFEQHLRQEQNNLVRLFERLDQSYVDRFIQQLASARKVIIIGLRNSYPVALHLRQQLMQVRSDVALVPQPGQSIGEELVGLTEQDLVIFVAFRRRSRIFDALLKQLLHSAASFALLADESLASSAEQADWYFECPLDSRSAFDSYGAAMCLVTLLSNRLLHLNLETGRERIALISHQYEELDELSLTYSGN